MASPAEPRQSCLLWVAFLLLLGVILASRPLSRMLNPEEAGEEPSMAERHELWMARHGRIYKDEAEKRRRLGIFKRNFEYVELFGRDGKGRGYELSANKYADLSEEEFGGASNHGVLAGHLPNGTTSTTGSSSKYGDVTLQDLPLSKDWREEGAVTAVKSQGGKCGSSWAFSAVAATEGVVQIQTGKLISLSEQQLIDCDTATGNSGCRGGLAARAFQYIATNGLATEDGYPYQEESSGGCNTSAFPTAAMISGHEFVTSNDEQALLSAVAHQPVAVRIAAGSREFYMYAGGVFTGPCGERLNHAVTIVGYGTTADGFKYWLAKNSWGKDWGEDGYMRILRDHKDRQGMCGLASFPSYPVGGKRVATTPAAGGTIFRAYILVSTSY